MDRRGDDTATLNELRDFSRMFISYMNHELRGAVNIIMGYATMVLDEWSGPLNEEQRQNMRQVTEGAGRLMRQLEDLLAACRTVILPADPVYATFSLNDVLGEVAAPFRDAAAEKHLDLVLPDAAAEVTTDRDALGLVLRQLLDNAVRYTEKGTITVACDTSDGSLTIRIADTGVGMTPEETEKLFNRFVRHSYAIRNRIPGTGIGLFIIGRIVRDKLGGSIQVQSEPGVGTTVSITLPAHGDIPA